MINEYIKYKDILKLKDGFNYIDLTRSFTELKKGLGEEELDELADAFDFMRKNFKILKTLKSNTIHSKDLNQEDGIFPSILPETAPKSELAVEYPVFKDERGNPLSVIMVPHLTYGMLPTITKGKFKKNQNVIFYHNDILFTAPVNLER